MKVTKSKNFNNIGLTEVKQHLRIQNDFIDDDNYLNLLIKTATRIAEDYLNNDIASTTTTIIDYDIQNSEYVINTDNCEILGVTGDTAITGYTLFNFFNYSTIVFPSFINVKNLKVVYTGGYTSTTLPDQIKFAILVKIAELYDFDRGNYINNSLKYTRTFENLLDPYKILF